MQQEITTKLSPGRIFGRLEEAFCYGSLFVLTLVPALEAILRTFFHSGVPDSSGILAHTFLALGLVSGMITAKNEDHLSIALVQNFSGEKMKTLLKAVTNCL
ncbi:MAG: hypothetical protein LBK63_08850, partial [Treponema sp.]|nr:hypothetical protein [Treponema sp.]